MKFKLPKLPIRADEMKGFISAETMSEHYHEHHQGYVDHLNELLKKAGREEDSTTLLELVRQSQGELYNQAAQAWNHTFYWLSLGGPDHAGPDMDFVRRVNKDFGSLDGMRDQMVDSGMKVFGSGWVWLTVDAKNDAMAIVPTANAENPLRHGLIPLLACDVWEHAYYLDYQSQRKDYLKHFLDHINYKFAMRNYIERDMTLVDAQMHDADASHRVHVIHL